MHFKNLEIPDERLERLSRTKKSVKTAFTVGKNIEYQRFFKVGDTLIRYNKRSNKVIKIDGIPERYIVARNDNGIVYVKKILKSGKLGTGIEAIAVEDFDNYEYQIDPAQIDSVLLGTEFDPRNARKRHNKIVDKLRRYNEKSRLRFKKDVEVQKWMANCKTGIKVWEDVFGDGKKINEYIVEKYKVEGKVCSWSSRIYYLHSLITTDGVKLDVRHFTEANYFMYIEQPMTFKKAEEVL
ncbi:MAG: hypothetical protein HWN81_00055 [Candidatus Lokiarchaeota archaeon]|nr:hypothetical protein [Candidatus Lokiarchaeota archaeon]